METEPDRSPSRAGEPDGATPADGDAMALDPQKLLRIAGVTREVLEEARRIRPEAGAVEHLRRVHDRITAELRGALPAELWRELDDLTPDVRDGTLQELALAHSEILGWMEGLFQGTQLALRAQALQAAQTIQQQMRESQGRPSLPEGGEATPGGSQYL